MKNTNCKLNPNALIWDVITLKNRNLSKTQYKLIKKQDSLAIIDDNAILMHGVGLPFEKRIKNILKILGKKKSLSIRFSDKQYGFTKNTWDGTIPVTIMNRKMNWHELFLKSGNRLSAIPLTQKQIELAQS